MRMVRVVALPTPENRHGELIHVDVFLNNDSRVVGDQPIFGMQGKFGVQGVPRSFPFVFYPTAGTIDFGTNTKDDRIGRFNLLEEKVVIGHTLTLESAHGKNTYRISDITELPIV